MSFLRDGLHVLKLQRSPLLRANLGYFGLITASAFLTLFIPSLQQFRTFIYGQLQAELAGEEGLLGVAGAAYRSGNIGYAALVTLGVNLSVGAFVWITLPSLVPGLSILTTMYRALMWGILFSPVPPASVSGLLLSLPTLLLEGEGYVLTLVASYRTGLALVKPSWVYQDAPLTRWMAFKRAWVDCAKLYPWVALTLAVAAVVEATTVITLAGIAV